MADDHCVNVSESRLLNMLVEGFNEHESKQFVASYGIKTPDCRVLSAEEITSGQSMQKLEGLAGKLAVKFLSRDVLHKTEYGAVEINVSATDVYDVCNTMLASPLLQDARCQGFLIEEMVPAGQEIVLGGIQDPTFGPIVMIGIGGVFLELLDDVAFRICPVDVHDVRSMLNELRGRTLLEGYRGAEPVDIDAIVQSVLGVGGDQGILTRYADFGIEIDINPLIVSARGAFAADAQVVVTGRNEKSKRESRTA